MNPKIFKHAGFTSFSYEAIAELLEKLTQGVIFWGLTRHDIKQISTHFSDTSSASGRTQKSPIYYSVTVETWESQEDSPINQAYLNILEIGCESTVQTLIDEIRRLRKWEKP